LDVVIVAVEVETMTTDDLSKGKDVNYEEVLFLCLAGKYCRYHCILYMVKPNHTILVFLLIYMFYIYNIRATASWRKKNPSNY